MVDSTSTQNLVNQDIVTAKQDNSRTNSAADKWWINMLAAVKLRQKGKTMVSKLPAGVFRHMLEYKFPMLSYRYSTPYMPISGAQDRKFPATDKLDYNNYMVGIENSKTVHCEYRMILKDKSSCNTQASFYMHSVSIQPADAVVNKIEIGYDSRSG
jgi:hypothetical protein